MRKSRRGSKGKERVKDDSQTTGRVVVPVPEMDVGGGGEEGYKRMQ